MYLELPFHFSLLLDLALSSVQGYSSLWKGIFLEEDKLLVKC